MAISFRPPSAPFEAFLVHPAVAFDRLVRNLVHQGAELVLKLPFWCDGNEQ